MEQINNLSDTVAINPISEYNIKSNYISPFLKGYRIDYMDDDKKSNIYPRAYTGEEAVDYVSHMADKYKVPSYTNDSNISYIQSKEGKDNSYTTKNKAGSSAYGKYQFMPATAKMYADQLGLDEYISPAAQEKIMSRALVDYKSKLNRWGVPKTNGNIYAIHQLGPSRAYRLFSNKLTEGDIQAMRDNIPGANSNLARDEVITKWKSIYL